MADQKPPKEDIVYSKLTESAADTNSSMGIPDIRGSVISLAGFDQIKYFSSDEPDSRYSTSFVKTQGAKSFNTLPEVYIQFHFSQFMEVLLCHMLHNVLLGPLSLPILLLFFPKTFISNLCFFPTRKRYWLTQIFVWLCFVTYVVTQYIRTRDDDQKYHLPCVRLASTLLAMNYTLRQMVIALKYGYYPRYKYRMLKKYEVPDDDLMKENSLYLWLTSNKGDLPLKELYAAIRRHEIELALFYIDFMVKPDPQADENYRARGNEIREKFCNFIQIETKLKTCRLSDMKVTQLLAQNRYFAGALAEEMISQGLDKSYHSVTKFVKFFLVISLVTTILPNFMATNEMRPVYFTLNFPDDVLGWFTVPAYWVGNTIVLTLNFVSFSLGLTTAKLRYSMMKQLTYMISPRKKHENEGIKRYPTVNLFDPIPLKSWSNIKRVSMDYALKYQKRAETGVSFQIFFYMTFMIFLVIQIFYTNVEFFDARSLVIVAIQLTLVLGFTVILMIVVARTNGIYQVMKGHVKEVRDILSDFVLVKYEYLEKDVTPKNLLYRLFNEKLRAEFSHIENREEFVEASVAYLKNLIACYDDILDEIAFEEENHPARALEIALTQPRLKRLTVGVLSVTFTALTYLIHRMR